MISFVEGILDSIEPSKIAVNVGGVGYGITVTSSVLKNLPPKGQKIRILTYLNVKEDALQLFGFSSKEERGLFLQLLSVSGIGPKGAMNIVSSFELNQLVTAIVKADVDMLTAAQGIGKKTAQRVIVELREKISKAYSLDASSGIFDASTDSPMLKDAVSALMALGYASKEARKAVSKGVDELSPGASVEDLIKYSLKSLSQV
ncbi:MAG: Holliday junction branch migration protein RuvA [Candidatus Margulisiibacteriota bacterium]